MENGVRYKTVLIAGGAGYIGSHTVVELLQAGCKVFVIDNLSNAQANPEDLEELPPSLRGAKQITESDRIHFVKGDTCNKQQVDEVFQKYDIDTVFDFTGRKAVKESTQFPILYYKYNMKGTMTLLKCMREHEVRNFIFSSSCTVYGAPNQDNLPVKETDPVGSCHCPYAKCKYFIECLLEDLARGEEDYWRIMIMRYFNPVGAHESGLIGEDPNGEPQNLMPKLAQIASGKCSMLNVYGEDYNTPDGTPIRDYVHVVDVAEAHKNAVQIIDSVSGIRTYNIGSGEGKSIWDMVNTFQEVCGIKIPLKVCARRPGDVPAIFCDPSKAKKELKWKLKRTHVQMCEDLWRFYRLNPFGYKSVQ
ncbi:UDP-glucose 4-epimerase-like [Clavelina lepadiformis]|uniref:UDP-glucose 4-epimerase-like n=1 Tax=Clavelina lepadiformis TaxID=159417 RepID=UPI004042D198